MMPDSEFEMFMATKELIGLFSAAQSAEMSLDEIKFVLKGKGLFFYFLLILASAA